MKKNVLKAMSVGLSAITIASTLSVPVYADEPVPEPISAPAEPVEPAENQGQQETGEKEEKIETPVTDEIREIAEQLPLDAKPKEVKEENDVDEDVDEDNDEQNGDVLVPESKGVIIEVTFDENTDNLQKWPGHHPEKPKDANDYLKESAEALDDLADETEPVEIAEGELDKANGLVETTADTAATEAREAYDAAENALNTALQSDIDAAKIEIEEADGALLTAENAVTTAAEKLNVAKGELLTLLQNNGFEDITEEDLDDLLNELKNGAILDELDGNSRIAIEKALKAIEKANNAVSLAEAIQGQAQREVDRLKKELPTQIYLQKEIVKSETATKEDKDKLALLTLEYYLRNNVYWYVNDSVKLEYVADDDYYKVTFKTYYGQNTWYDEINYVTDVINGHVEVLIAEKEHHEETDYDNLISPAKPAEYKYMNGKKELPAESDTKWDNRAEGKDTVYALKTSDKPYYTDSKNLKVVGEKAYSYVLGDSYGYKVVIETVTADVEKKTPVKTHDAGSDWDYNKAVQKAEKKQHELEKQYGKDYSVSYVMKPKQNGQWYGYITIEKIEILKNQTIETSYYAPTKYVSTLVKPEQPAVYGKKTVYTNGQYIVGSLEYACSVGEAAINYEYQNGIATDKDGKVAAAKEKASIVNGKLDDVFRAIKDALSLKKDLSAKGDELDGVRSAIASAKSLYNQAVERRRQLDQQNQGGPSGGPSGPSFNYSAIPTISSIPTATIVPEAVPLAAPARRVRQVAGVVEEEATEEPVVEETTPEETTEVTVTETEENPVVIDDEDVARAGGTQKSFFARTWWAWLLLVIAAIGGAVAYTKKKATDLK